MSTQLLNLTTWHSFKSDNTGVELDSTGVKLDNPSVKLNNTRVILDNTTFKHYLTTHWWIWQHWSKNLTAVVLNLQALVLNTTARLDMSFIFEFKMRTHLKIVDIHWKIYKTHSNHEDHVDTKLTGIFSLIYDANKK